GFVFVKVVIDQKFRLPLSLHRQATSRLLEIVKKCINNSLVRISKLLHFINPSIYAIWVSRIFRYITRKKLS
ncbi:MAG TPA: hypothetical protein PLT79_01470, partial [Flavobacterium sp.]|nr:hypothetical protein [Flavobacterium sp.]HRL70351.1 hypothetical protein [Flavobacterium sp.]